MVRKDLVLRLALATITIMPFIALVMDEFIERISLASAVLGHIHILLQIPIGAAIGLIGAFFAQKLVEAPFMEKVNSGYINAFGGFRLDMNEIVLVSLCAGVGEEILFRGAMQPLVGVIFTSVFFVAIHGYLNPKNWRLSVYGIYMTAVIIGIGYASEFLGLVTAIVAHTVIDIYLLIHLQKNINAIPATDDSLIEN